MKLHRLAYVILIAACAACSGGSSDPIDADIEPPDAEPAPDAIATGPGSHTLLAQGFCVVEDTNNMTSGQYRVDCEIRVTRGGAPVNDAIVTINPAPPAFAVTLGGETLDPNLYTGNYNPFADTARVKIYDSSTPTDYIPETTMAGPRLYMIEQPQMNANVPTSAPLHISWSQPQGAEDSLDVVLDSGYEMLGIPDTGIHDIPAASLVVGADELIITRWKRNFIPGGAPGSYIDFGSRNHLPFTGI
jgi:hypothetical protein